jgi:hypothetical protein
VGGGGCKTWSITWRTSAGTERKERKKKVHASQIGIHTICWEEINLTRIHTLKENWRITCSGNYTNSSISIQAQYISVYLYIWRSVWWDEETMWEIYTWEILKHLVVQHTLEGSPKHRCEDNIQKDIQETGRRRGMTWFRTGPNGGLLWKWCQAIELHKLCGISLLAEDLLPSLKKDWVT